MGVFGDWAARYYESGYSVIPVDGKRAFTAGWSEWCEKLPQQEMIDDWVGKFPSHNIGLCTGPASGVMALDIDTDDKKIIDIILSIVPPSPCSKRGVKGITYFYKFTDEIKTSCKVKGNNIFDILAGGSQTVMPPSWHPTGNIPYVWVGKSLLDIDDELPVLGRETVNKLIKALSGFDLPAADLVTGAGRNNSLKSYVASLMDVFTLEEIVSKALFYDQSVFEGNELFRDKSEFKSDDRNYNAFEFVSNIKKTVMKLKKDRGETNTVTNKLDEFKTIVEHGFYSQKLESGGVVKTFPQFLVMADYFKFKHNLKASDAVCFLYNGTHYEQIDDLMIQHMISGLTKGQCKTTHHLNTFFKFVKVQNAVNLSKITPPNGIFNLKNGVLDFKNKALFPHSPDRFFKYVINHNYEPDAKCPNWLAFLDRTFNGDAELIQMSKEIFGYVLSGSQPWLHKAFFLYGEGRNGKSTWLDVLREIVGINNISAVPLKNLDKPFSVVTTDGKLANIVGETSSEDLSSEAFKTAVSGEHLMAAQKGQPEYPLAFTAKLIFAANKKPYFKDATAGSYEKLVFLPFNNYIRPEDRIRDYASKFLFGEIPGIINWAIEGLLELEKRGRLVESEAVKNELAAYRLDADSALAWFEDTVKIGRQYSKAVVTPKDYYQNYRNWCIKEYKHPVLKSEFSKRVINALRRSLPTLTENRTGNVVSITGNFLFPEIEILREKTTIYKDRYDNNYDN